MGNTTVEGPWVRHQQARVYIGVLLNTRIRSTRALCRVLHLIYILHHCHQPDQAQALLECNFGRCLGSGLEGQPWVVDLFTVLCLEITSIFPPFACGSGLWTVAVGTDKREVERAPPQAGVTQGEGRGGG